MKLVSVGVNYRSAPIGVRESLVFGREDAAVLCKKLVGSGVISEALLLCTCNRTELYCVGSCVEGILETAYSALSGFSGCRAEHLRKVSYSNEGHGAVRHLFRVASSLDAMVVGESQILGQMKSAYQQATENGTVGPYLHKAFHSAFRVAKRVRTETDIASRPVSVGTLAVDLIENIAGPLEKLNTLVIGAGETGSLVACRLKERGAGHIWIANRSAHPADELAKKVCGLSVPFDSWKAHLKTADVVVTSVGGGVIMGEGDMDGSCRHVIIDLAVPRNVDESVKKLATVKLYNIDDLQALAEKNLAMRQDAASRAEEIISAEATSVAQELQYVKLAPAILELQRKCESAVREGLKRLYLENPEWSERERESARICLESVVGKILHDPIRLAKEELVRPGANGIEMASVLKNIFELRGE